MRHQQSHSLTQMIHNFERIFNASFITRTTVRFTFFLFAFSLLSRTAHAQFPKPVIILQGTVTSNSGGSPLPVRVTVTEQSDTKEWRACNSNSVTGKYLLILKPNTGYSVHVESDQIMPFDTVITTQEIEQTVKVILDFKPELRDHRMASEGILRVRYANCSTMNSTVGRRDENHP